jgi:flagellar protein FlaG
MEIGALQKDPQNVPVAPVSTPTELAEQNRELIQAVKSVNATEHFGLDNELTFAIDRRTQRPVIRVVNTNTKEVIQQIPPEYVLELAQLTRDSSG